MEQPGKYDAVLGGRENRKDAALEIRITGSLTALNQEIGKLKDALEKQGYTVVSTSEIYPNCAPREKEGRVYLKISRK